MKIKVIIGGNVESKCEIDVDKLEPITIIRNKIYKFTTEIDIQFLIYKKIILENENMIGFYKICTNDEIWLGRIETYMKCDDVIVSVFMTWWPRGVLVRLIVNGSSSIGDIRSILEGILPDGFKLADVWNCRGESMGNNQVVSEIHTSKGEMIMICRLDDGNVDRSFEECCVIYDRYLLFEFRDLHHYNLPSLYRTSWFVDEFVSIGLRLLPIVSSNDRLQVDVGPMARCMKQARLLCCTTIADYTCVVLRDLTSSMEVRDLLGKLTFMQLEPLLRVSLCSVVLDHIDSCHHMTPTVTAAHIIHEAVQLLTCCRTSPPNDLHSLQTKFFNRLAIKCRNEDQLDLLIDETYYFPVRIIASACIPMNIVGKPETVLQLKKCVAIQTGLSFQQIYLIDNLRYIRLKDDDVMSPNYMRYLCQIVQSMDDIDILTMIGRGSFGKIYLCQNRMSGKQFVLKRPVQSYSLHREIIILSLIGVHSSNICRPIGLFNDRDTICMAMDYKSGGTLTEFIRNRKGLREHEIARISLQILRQIKDIHACGVIHRDINPNNILLDKAGDSYLIDFGISQLVDGFWPGKLTADSDSAGNYYYMAPEVINDGFFTEKIDIWSFGATVVEMVTGLRPFHNLSFARALAKISTTRQIEYDSPDDMSTELTDFLNACLQPEPILRASIDELLTSKFIRKHVADANIR